MCRLSVDNSSASTLLYLEGLEVAVDLALRPLIEEQHLAARVSVQELALAMVALVPKQCSAGVSMSIREFVPEL